MLVLLKGRIYDLRRSVWLRCLDIRTKIHKEFFSHSKCSRGEYTHNKANAQDCFHFFKLREVG
jgi:hypothetical protein